jgi:hypothetical protein
LSSAYGTLFQSNQRNKHNIIQITSYISPEQWNETRNEQQEKQQKTQTQRDWKRHFKMIHEILNIPGVNWKIPRIKQKWIHNIPISLWENESGSRKDIIVINVCIII